MKYWYIFDEVDKKPINVRYEQNKLILYTKKESVARAFSYLTSHNYSKHDFSIKEIEI